jgi:hypothetical protein
MSNDSLDLPLDLEFCKFSDVSDGEIVCYTQLIESNVASIVYIRFEKREFSDISDYELIEASASNCM